MLRFLRLTTKSNIAALAVLAVWVIVGALPAPAQDRAPVVSVRSRFDSPRSHAPLQFDATISWRFPEVLEGRLILDFYVSERKVHTWISREIALSSSEILLPVMVHPLILPTEKSPIDVDVRFEANGRTYTQKDQLDLPYWVDWKQMQVIGVVHHGQASSITGEFFDKAGEESSLLSPLRLDSYLPDREFSRHLASRIETVPPETAPTSALEWFGFDLVIVTSSGLRRLNQAQLDSLAEWTEGGGLICVASQTVTAPIQTEFLERLAGSSASVPQFAVDASGKVTPLEPDASGRMHCRPGIGRALLIYRPLAANDPTWQRDALELWRMRPSQRRRIAERGQWEFPLETWPHTLLNPEYFPMEVGSSADAELQQLLMPTRVEGMPFHTVATLLGLCLLAVAPAEYLVLSLLNRRRWTWIVFPTVSLLFAFYTIRLAQSHMGKADFRRSLSFVDLSADGRPVRHSRFELLFAASEKQIVEEYRQALLSPWEFREAVQSNTTPDAMFRRANSSPRYHSTEALAFAGRVPLNYQAIRSVRQWMPQLVRETTLGREIVVPPLELPFSEITAARLADERQRSLLFDELRSAMPEAKFAVLHGTHVLKPETESVGSMAEKIAGDPLEEFSLKVCFRPSEGLFRILGQISPNGAGNLDDLAVFDPMDPTQWLLVVISTDEGGNTLVYRLPLHGGSR